MAGPVMASTAIRRTVVVGGSIRSSEDENDTNDNVDVANVVVEVVSNNNEKVKEDEEQVVKDDGYDIKDEEGKSHVATTNEEENLVVGQEEGAAGMIEVNNKEKEVGTERKDQGREEGGGAAVVKGGLEHHRKNVIDQRDGNASSSTAPVTMDTKDVDDHDQQPHRRHYSHHHVQFDDELIVYCDEIEEVIVEQQQQKKRSPLDVLWSSLNKKEGIDKKELQQEKLWYTEKELYKIRKDGLKELDEIIERYQKKTEKSAELEECKFKEVDGEGGDDDQDELVLELRGLEHLLEQEEIGNAVRYATRSLLWKQDEYNMNVLATAVVATSSPLDDSYCNMENSSHHFRDNEDDNESVATITSTTTVSSLASSCNVYMEHVKKSTKLAQVYGHIDYMAVKDYLATAEVEMQLQLLNDQIQRQLEPKQASLSTTKCTSSSPLPPPRGGGSSPIPSLIALKRSSTTSTFGDNSSICTTSDVSIRKDNENDDGNWSSSNKDNVWMKSLWNNVFGMGGSSGDNKQKDDDDANKAIVQAV